MRGATTGIEESADQAGISILAPLAGRDSGLSWLYDNILISILAPLAGRDAAIALLVAGQDVLFQSSRPLRGATEDEHVRLAFVVEFQSSRPLRGATELVRRNEGILRDFNPRAPCGARPVVVYFVTVPTIFQSSRPLRGATCS